MKYENTEPELLHLKKLVSNGGVAIDVGANIGFYSYGLSQICRKVHSFEINPSVSRFLKKLNSKKIQIYDIGLSDSVQEAKLFIPINQKGFSLHGWASLHQGNCPGVTKHEEKKVFIQSLDSFEIKECDFLKIDVEGHEMHVLNGALETVKRTLPRILIEIQPKNFEDVKCFLLSLGYYQREIKEKIGCKGGEGNFLFDPPSM